MSMIPTDPHAEYDLHWRAQMERDIATETYPHEKANPPARDYGVGPELFGAFTLRAVGRWSRALSAAEHAYLHAKSGVRAA